MLVKYVRLASPRQGEDSAVFLRCQVASAGCASQPTKEPPGRRKEEGGNVVNMSAFLKIVKPRTSKVSK